MDNRFEHRTASALIAIVLACSLVFCLPSCTLAEYLGIGVQQPTPAAISEDLLPAPQDRAEEYVAPALTWEDLPAYDGENTWMILDDGEPAFSADEITTNAFERYSPLDEKGRAGVAMACLGLETLPTDARGDISMIEPSGWRADEYAFIENYFLYNRAHLIAHSLASENANAWNFVTGTRYMNAETMLPYEQEVSYYIHATGNHVMYRVSPIFSGDELLCRGVQMEGYSVEDDGEGICFNVFLYNVQPAVEIDYATGENWLVEAQPKPGEEPHTFVINTKSGKVHLPDCPSVKDIAFENRLEVETYYSQLELEGYKPCGYCRPYETV